MIEPSTSFEKVERRRAIALLRLWSQLKASTAGTATIRPMAVMMSASPTGPATVSIEAWPEAPILTSARRIPITVPNRPTNGAVEPKAERKARSKEERREGKEGDRKGRK